MTARRTPHSCQLTVQDSPMMAEANVGYSEIMVETLHATRRLGTPNYCASNIPMSSISSRSWLDYGEYKNARPTTNTTPAAIIKISGASNVLKNLIMGTLFTGCPTTQPNIGIRQRRNCEAR